MPVFLKNPRIIKLLISAAFVLVGATLGYVYYRFWGCNGTCAITSSPYRSAVYGGIMGFLLRHIII